MSPREVGQRPEPKRNLVGSHRASARETYRSRKGCPECRKRKIKCDETRPECGQCLKSGRACHIIDGLFKQHSYTFLATPQQVRAGCRQGTRPSGAAQDAVSREHAGGDARRETPEPIDLIVDSTPGNATSPVQTRSPASPTQLEESLAATEPAIDSPPQNVAPDQNSPTQLQSAVIEPTIHSSPPYHGFNAELLLPHISPRAQRGSSHVCNYQADVAENQYDRYEVAFFLRYFSEGPGRWMDVFAGQHSYFSQHVVQLAHTSTLVRYAACAVAAKQLGQMNDPISKIQQTHSQRLMFRAFSETTLDFLWYGAKYYEKAIQLLAKQLSHDDNSIPGLSPCCIYQTGLTPVSNDPSFHDEQEEAASVFQVIAACILCQYEDLSATMRAWSGHINGIYKLLQSHIHASSFPISFPMPLHAPQPMRAIEVSFWFFALHDMSDAYVSRKKCRVDTQNLLTWRKMGLPLDDLGHFVVNYAAETHVEAIFFKALVRLLCQLVNLETGDASQWTCMEDEFNQWYDMLPPSFSCSIDWPCSVVEDEEQISSTEATYHEAWFCNDLCAITMAFYHMARMLLLIHRPVDVFLMGQPQNALDILSTYHSLQRDLRQHAMKIIPIARAMPDDRVRKNLLQPLYTAGRSLVDTNERQELLDLLLQIESDFGFATEYRLKDLSREWGIPWHTQNRIRADEECQRA